MINKGKRGIFFNEFVISIIARIIFIAASFINSILLARILGKSSLGEFTYITNVSTIVSMLLGLGIGESYSYFRKKYGESIRNKYINIIYFITLCYIPLLIIFVNSGYFMIILISIIQQLNTQMTYIALVDNANKKSILQIFSNLVYTLLLITIGISSYIDLKLILYIYILKTIVNTFLLMGNMKIMPKGRLVSVKYIREVVRFGFLPMVNSFLSLLNYKSDIVILKIFVDYKDISLYSVALTLANMLWIIPDAFKDILFRRTAKSDSINDIILSIKLNVYFCIVIIIGFTIFGKLFLKIFYGIDYIESYFIVILLFIGGIPMIYYKLINTLYISIGKQKFTVSILIFSVISNVLLNFLLIPYLGIYGSAFSAIISYSLCGMIYILMFKRDYKLSFRSLFMLNRDERFRLQKFFKRI